MSRCTSVVRLHTLSSDDRAMMLLISINTEVGYENVAAKSFLPLVLAVLLSSNDTTNSKND